MKRLPLALLCAGTVLSLGACGGGGGGGGGGDSGSGGGGGGGNSLDDKAASNAAFTHRQWAGADATVKAAPNALSTVAQTKSALLPRYNQGLLDGGVLSPSTLSLKAESNGSVSLREGSTTVANFNASNMNFYTKNGMDFSVMSKTAQKTVSGFQGSVTQTNSLWLGKMDYASFGFWLQVNEGKPGSATVAAKVIGDAAAFTAGAAAYKMNGFSAGPSGLSFTGLAVGEISIQNPSANSYYNMPMIGTAVLTVAATSGSNPTGLVLNFPGFYRFDANMGSMNGGSFGGTFTGITKLGDSSVPDLPAINTYTTKTYSANTFGTSANNPTEAVGTWTLMQASGGKTTWVGGAFGGKKN